MEDIIPDVTRRLRQFAGKGFRTICKSLFPAFLSRHRVTSDPNFATTWLRTNDDLLSALICEMGKILGYNYSLVDIKRNVYTPQAHVDVEADDILIRKSLVALLQKREGYLPIYFEGTQDEAVTEKQSQLQELMIKYYSQKIENK